MKKETLKELAKFFLKLMVGAGVIGFLIWKTPPGLPNVMRQADLLWLAAAFLLYALHLFVNAWRWYILLRAQKIDCSLLTACSLTMQSFFFSLVLPGAIGGDLVRITFLAARLEKGRKFDGAFTILMDRFTGMIGIFLVALCMLPFVWSSIGNVGGIMKQLIYLVLAGSAGGILGAFVVFGHKKWERFRLYCRMKAFADNLSHGMYSRVSDALDSYRNCGKEIVVCILSSVIGVNLVLGVMAWCVAKAISPAAGSFTSSLGAITIGNIAGLLPTTPSGVGTRDLFIIPVLKGGGMNADAALGVSLTISAIIILFNLSGGLFFLFSRKKDPSRGKEE